MDVGDRLSLVALALIVGVGTVAVYLAVVAPIERRVRRRLARFRVARELAAADRCARRLPVVRPRLDDRVGAVLPLAPVRALRSNIGGWLDVDVAAEADDTTGLADDLGIERVNGRYRVIR